MLELSLLDDPRLDRLAAFTAAWMVVWSVILMIVPAGASGRNHILSLNAAHGLVSTVMATLTLMNAWDTSCSVALSLAFFIVDLVVMVNADGLTKLMSLNRSRVMDYAHHVLGVFWGILLFAHETTVCTAAFGNAYVWIQTNEVSTPFYNWFRITNNTIAGVLFVVTFFLSRIAFNTVYLIPRLATACDTRYLLGCMPFFVLQYVWFVMIIQKMQRTLAAKKTKKST